MPDEIAIFAEGPSTAGARWSRRHRQPAPAQQPISRRNPRSRRRAACSSMGHPRPPRRRSHRSSAGRHWRGTFTSRDVCRDPERTASCPSAFATTGRATSCATSTRQPPRRSRRPCGPPRRRASSFVLLEALNGQARVEPAGGAAFGQREARWNASGIAIWEDPATTRPRSPGRADHRWPLASSSTRAPAMAITPRSTRPTSGCGPATDRSGTRGFRGQAPLRPGQRVPLQQQHPAGLRGRSTVSPRRRRLGLSVIGRDLARLEPPPARATS